MVYFFYGPEEFTRREKCHSLISDIQKKGDVEIKVFSALKDGSVAESIDFLSSKTLFSGGKRLALIQDAEEFHTADLALIVERASLDKGCVALISSSWTQKQYKKASKKFDSLVSKKQYFEKLKGNDLLGYLSRRAKEKGLEIEKKALVLLQKLYGDNISLLSHEIDRLSLWKDHVHVSDILSLPEHKEEKTLYEGSRALLGTSLSERLSLFEALIFQGIGSEALFYYMSAVASKKPLIERLSSIDTRMKRGEDLDLLFLSYVISQN